MTLRLWDAASGKELRRFEGHTGSLYGAALSPNGRRVLSSGDDRTIRLWDAGSGKQLHVFEPQPDVVWAVVFLPDGRHALSSCRDGTVRLWRLPDPPPPEKVGEGRRPE